MAGRMQAVREVLLQVQQRGEHIVDSPAKSICQFFGCNVFNDDAMLKYMQQSDYLAMKDSVQNGRRLTAVIADRIADAMKRWAIEKGVTHYAHWFQPWTGKTAEKHDSFFTLDVRTGGAVEEFGGSQLIQGEPDGSSFPGGGLRTTFEARGYTAWDPSSPAFIMEVGGKGMTLCIPSTFITFGGHAMDYKLPLLRSMAYVNKASVAVCQLFDPNVTKVNTTLGWEQEYFVIDASFFSMRPDLTMCGRTLLGKAAPRGQQLEDHYFGSIPERVFAFQRDLEIEAHKLGIPLRTRHNEVAPSQFEVAPMFEDVNVATDHNLLLMDLMDRVAKRHQFSVLLHEKPFAGVNGSGKHHNFSLATNTGVNLLSPGDTPESNLQFLIYFVCIIRAVYLYADLLRATTAYAANDHRLGANEAPPAIVSIFVGSALLTVLDRIEQGDWNNPKTVEPQRVALGEIIPMLQRDSTDRNRTSPFAFTGSKFEIRMPGSSVNCGGPMTVINTILGKQLNDFMRELREITGKAKSSTTTSAMAKSPSMSPTTSSSSPSSCATSTSSLEMDSAIFQILQRYIASSRAILFEGDNYSEAWAEEAKRRALPIRNTTPEALEAFLSESSRALFQETGVYTLEELHGYYDVKMDAYFLQLQIESRTIGEIAVNHVIPAALEYQTKLASNVASLKAIGVVDKATVAQRDFIEQISSAVIALRNCVDDMVERRRAANQLPSARDRAWAYLRTVKPLIESLRVHADKLEYLVPDKDWPMIKYREMLFIR